jgi:hypothetical protein
MKVAIAQEIIESLHSVELEKLKENIKLHGRENN